MTTQPEAELTRRPIGHGSVSLVWEVTHPQIGCMVMKELRPDLKGRERELAARSLRHEAAVCHRLRRNRIPGVVGFLSADIGDDPFVVLQRVPGLDLDNYYQQLGRLPWPIVCTVGYQVATTLVRLARRGLVHSDVKPGNIMFDNESTVLIDFGTSFVMPGSPLLTQPSRFPLDLALAEGFHGTPYYVSPEQELMAGISPATDVYSLAASLFEACSGRPVFTGRSAESIARQHVTAAPPRLDRFVRGLPTDLNDLVAAGLSKLPSHRPTAAQFARAIKPFAQLPRQPS